MLVLKGVQRLVVECTEYLQCTRIVICIIQILTINLFIYTIAWRPVGVMVTFVIGEISPGPESIALR